MSERELIYVYAKDFEWINPIDVEKFNGHPFNTKVYRVYYNKRDRNYELYLDDDRNTIIVIPSLKAVPDGYTGELVKITRENIVDLKLPQEELDRLYEWLSEKREVIKIPDTPVILGNEEAELTSFMVNVAELYKTQYTIFDALHTFIEYANNRAPFESMDELNLSLSKDYGAGLNVGRAFACLAQYVSDDPRVAECEEDLLEAIYNLINEQARRETHEDCT
jgi:hypothetical protein